MKLASELLNASREELIAYLKSWGLACHDTDPDIVLRLMAQRNFLAEGPGAGPMRPSGGPKPDVRPPSSGERVQGALYRK